LGEAVRTAHDFLWNEFCDWYLEIAKIELRAAQTEQQRAGIRANLAWVFEHMLRLLHPMMPFVTEEIWQSLGVRGPETAPAVIVAPWPAASGQTDADAERRMASVMELVRGVRNVRAEYRVDPGRWVPATVVVRGEAEFYGR